jgi:acetoin utilization protein AcuB
MAPSPYVVEHDATLAHAAKLMTEHAVRHLPVVRFGLVVGLVSERDLHAVQGLSGGDADRVKVAEAMTPVPYAVPPEMPLRLVARTMAEQRYGCALVTDDETHRVLGVFTLTDALHALATILEEP